MFFLFQKLLICEPQSIFKQEMIEIFNKFSHKYSEDYDILKIRKNVDHMSNKFFQIILLK